MGILSEYENALSMLYETVKKIRLERDNLFINEKLRIYLDEIEDLEYAISEMRRIQSDDYVGYRPRRDTLLSRPDFYQTIL